MLTHIFKILWKKRRQNALLMLELFISFLILTAVFSYLYYNYQQLATPLGFETEHRYLVQRYDYDADYEDEAYAEQVEQLRQSLLGMPEIEAVSFGNNVYPFSQSIWTNVLEVNQVSIRFLMVQVDDTFANTMGLELVAGRWFEPPTEHSPYQDVVVNEAFIEQNFNGANMLDSIINPEKNMRVVGVVKNYKYNGEFSWEEPTVIEYLSPESREAMVCYLAVQPGTPAAFEEQVNRLVFETTGNKDFLIKNLEEMRAENNRDSWIAITALSALALFLAINVAMGLFGVLWQAISSRRYEISIRKAMGATEGQIMGQFILEVFLLAGMVILLGSLLVVQVPMFELLPVEAGILYTGLLLAMLFVSLMVLGCALYPSWRAAMLHPAEGLKEL